MFQKLGFKSSSASSSNSSIKKNLNDERNSQKFNSKIYETQLQYDPKGPVELAISIESPPCVMYGTTSNSTGALLSGLLKVIIKPCLDSPSKQVHLKYVNLKLIQKLEYASPFIMENNDILSNCSNCLEKKVELANWDILKDKDILVKNNSTTTSGDKSTDKDSDTESDGETMGLDERNTDIFTSTREAGTPISVGEHSYPFSQLLSGRLPSSSKYGLNADARISYELIAELQYYIPSTTNKHVGKNNLKTISLTLPVVVSHSILRGHDKNSVRVFPPTEVTATCTLPNVVYPKSTFPLELRLEGVATDLKRWRMRSLNWRIEEKTKIRQHSCESHKKTLKNIENQIRDEQKSGKKTSTGNGSSSGSGNHRHKNIGQRRPLKRNTLSGPTVSTTVIDEGNEQFLLEPIRSLENSQGNPASNAITANGIDNALNTVPNSGNNVEGEEPHNEDIIDNHDITNPEGLGTTNQDGNNSNQLPSAALYGSNELLQNSTTSLNNDYNGTVHPNDYVLRQQLINQQRMLRAHQIAQERKKDISLYTEEVRTIAHNTVKNGWKSDFDNGGKIELITDIDCMHLDSGITNSKRNISSKNYKKNQHFINFLKSNKSNISCDVEDPVLGIYISHILVVEIVVAEEALQYANGAPIHHAPSKKPVTDKNVIHTTKSHSSSAPNTLSPTTSRTSSASMAPTSLNKSTSSYKPQMISVPTGAARVLRMQFRLIFTERSGIGIPWDDEVPPTYQDIKYLSPPSYHIAMSPVMSNEVTFNHTVNNIHSAISPSFMENLNNGLDALTLSNTRTESALRNNQNAYGNGHEGSGLDDNDDRIHIGPTEMNPPPNVHFNSNISTIQSINGNVVGQRNLFLSPHTTNIMDGSANISNVFNSTQ